MKIEIVCLIIICVALLGLVGVILAEDGDDDFDDNYPIY